MYKYSVYRFDLFEMPDYVRFSESPMPGRDLSSGSVAAKLEIFLNGFDGSVSWFNGYDPKPGVEAGEMSGSSPEDLTMEMYARAFRQQSLGLDFSFGLGSFGVRGEAALRDPLPDYRDKVFAPGRDLRYILEVDRSFGDFSLMAMYLGHYVLDYTEGPVAGGIPDIDPMMLQDPAMQAQLGPMMDQQLAAFNRMLFDQIYEYSHSLALRPAVDLFHGVSKLELTGMYNMSTDEWGLFPRFTWNVNDNLKMSLGGEYFDGPEKTRNNLIAPVFNGGYFELRYSF